MNYRRVTLLVLLLFYFPAYVLAECEKSKELYDKAIRKGIENQEKIRLLESSISDCPSFAAYFELGKSYALSGKTEKGIEILQNACMLTKQKQEKSETFHAIARIYRSMGNDQDAAVYYKSALKENRNRPLELEFMEVLKTHNQSVVQSDVIAGTLKKGLTLHKAIGVVPSLDIKVPFEYNSYSLTSEGKTQAREIGKAMTKIPKRFILIGHTDSRGSDEYNDDLSLNRANAVKSFIVNEMNMDEARISVEGKGKRALLFHGDTEDDHAHNRRVEIRLDIK